MTIDESPDERKRRLNREAQRRRRASGKARETDARYRARSEVKEARSEYMRGWYAENREAALARNSARYAEKREDILRAQINRRYNIDRDEWIERQGGLCAVCASEFTAENPPCVDHDHACCAGDTSCGRCVRGLLCGPCNKGLGQFRDNPDHLMSAVAYLLGRTNLLERNV